jgi:hypothetical protein
MKTDYKKHKIHNDDNNVFETGIFIIQENKITFHRANYIDDGWYVEQIDQNIIL